MACGTGKTFTSLRIAEAHDAKRILFIAPSIALVGQARREYVRQSQSELDTLIVCSDTSAGRNSEDRGGNSLTDLLQLEAMVTEDPKIKERTTRALYGERKALSIRAEHLDAKSSAYDRAQALSRLDRAANSNTAELLCNVGIFSEGVDVPSLDAVIFLEPRKRQIDVVQAVGRVMRKAPGKKMGYVIVPVVIPEGKNALDALAKGTPGYKTVGAVLRALQSHDGRLRPDIARFVLLATPKTGAEEEPEDWSARRDTRDKGEPYHKETQQDDNAGNSGDKQEETLSADMFNLSPFQEGIFARLVDASGLGSQGKINADEIEYSVQFAARRFIEGGYAPLLAAALNEPYDNTAEEAARTKQTQSVCTVAALLIINGCLLHKRLCGIKSEHLGNLRGLEGLGAQSNLSEQLIGDWETILKHDYKPVFESALDVLLALPDEEEANNGLYRLIQCANSVADSLSDLGYDHAGPLYHRVLGSAESDGAFYTKNVSALLLARLALSGNDIDRNNPDTIKQFRVIDPACGTGTLLMAALKTIKDQAPKGTDQRQLHRDLVEHSLVGLDINRQATQLAASNLTLGAPDVDYQRMNIYTMPHGMIGQNVRCGSLELLARDDDSLFEQEFQSVLAAGGEQIDGRAEESVDTDGQFDMVIMNPPFSNNVKRGVKHGQSGKKELGRREQFIKSEIQTLMGQQAANCINSNSVSTFFTPLADMLLNNGKGTLAKVMPVTACVGSSGVDERK